MADDKKKVGTEDPTSHASDGGASAADASEKAKAAAEEDNSIVGKIRKSGLHFVQDHTIGGAGYVGISPQNDPKASEASKRLSAVTSLDSVSPRTGMQIRMKDGSSFAVADGFGPETVPADWAKVNTPDGKPLFA